MPFEPNKKPMTFFLLEKSWTDSDSPEVAHSKLTQAGYNIDIESVGLMYNLFSNRLFDQMYNNRIADYYKKHNMPAMLKPQAS